MRAVGVVRRCQTGKDRAPITPNSEAKIERKNHTMQQKKRVLNVFFVSGKSKEKFIFLARKIDYQSNNLGSKRSFHLSNWR